MKTTRYFEQSILAKRPYLLHHLPEIAAIVQRPLHEIEPFDRRFRRWGWVGGQVHRVIVLPDGETVHNAFPDPTFRG